MGGGFPWHIIILLSLVLSLGLGFYFWDKGEDDGL